MNDGLFLSRVKPNFLASRRTQCITKLTFASPCPSFLARSYSVVAMRTLLLERLELSLQYYSHNHNVAPMPNLLDTLEIRVALFARRREREEKKE